jgi:crotonobetainyl-CoA:carnitine CoA-transferase CaiB-like acyl-CoA transferase
MTPLLAELKTRGIRREQLGNTAYYAAPSDAYRTRTGWIVVPTVGAPMFRRWARLVGREDLIDDPRCKDDLSRADNADIINEAMSRWCAARTRDEAIAELESARIPCGPCYDLDEVLADPQVRSRRLLEQIEFPGGKVPVPVASPPVRLSETPAPAVRRAPMLGEHTDEVLQEIGFTAREIATLREANAV